MKCKYCGQELPEGVRLCPDCGKDNASVPEQEDAVIVPAEDMVLAGEPGAEEEVAASPEVKKMKRIAIASGCIAVLAVLALVLFFVLRAGGNSEAPTQPSSQTQPTKAPFEAVSYTVSDSDAIAKADVVVATLGDAKLTNGELQIYYQMQFVEFVQQYGMYLSYFGLDYKKPLDEQECALKEGYSWQQYFLETALEVWRGNQALAMQAKENNFQMASEYRQQLDALEGNMAEMAAEYGFDSADALLKAQCGANTTIADYRSYMETYFMGSLYYEQCYENLHQPTREELDAYFQANKEKLEANGIKQDGTYSIDVRHILIQAAGTENEDGTITFTDAEKAATAKAKAEEILNTWLENPTEEHFSELAKEHTADGNGDDGGLYEGVTPGQMVASFNDWCFDESRKAGDYGIVETRFGYHIMFFSQRGEEVWLTKTRSAYLQEEAQRLVNAALDAYEFEATYENIALVYVDMT